MSEVKIIPWSYDESISAVREVPMAFIWCNTADDDSKDNVLDDDSGDNDTDSDANDRNIDNDTTTTTTTTVTSNKLKTMIT